MKTYVIKFRGEVTNKVLYMEIEVYAQSKLMAINLAKAEAMEHQTWVGNESVDWQMVKE